jgi:hypothetical protein
MCLAILNRQHWEEGDAGEKELAHQRHSRCAGMAFVVRVCVRVDVCACKWHAGEKEPADTESGF